MERSTGSLSWQSMYKILIGSVVPRPIGWISSINEKGQPNLAPFSFFTVACPNPPTILFCPTMRGTDLDHKDTLRNIQETGEFVVNIVTEALVAPMNLTSTEFPDHINEFEAAGLTPEPSFVVRPPRVAESPIHFECKLVQVVDLGRQPGGGAIVIGHIIHLHIKDEVLIGEDKIDLEKVKPVGRLAGSAYTRVTDIFEIARPASQINPRVVKD